MTVKVTREAEPQIELYGAYSGTLVGNGRVSLTFVAADTYLIMVPKNAVSKPQLELGSFATSYIPTAASTVTRNADVASVNTSQFPYSKTESTLVATFDQAAATNTFSTRTYVVAVFDSGNTRFALRGGDSGANPAFVYGNESTNVALFNATSYAANSVIKAAGAAGSGGGAFYINGAQVGTSALVLNTVDGRMGLGCSHLGAQFLNGHLRQITYIPRRLTNAELQSRTA